MKRVIFLFPVILLLASINAKGQEQQGSKSLEDCIKYALDYQTKIRQSLLDERITEGEIRVRLADWYPQINFSGNYQNNFQRPTSIFNGTATPLGTYNSAGGYFSLNQTIFNRDVVIAQQSAGDVR